MFIFERERQSACWGGAEREGDTESETGSRLWAVSTEPDAGLELTDREIMTWAEVGRLTDWATQAPLTFIHFWETEHEWGSGRENGSHRIWSRLQTPSCQHRVQHGAQTHQLQDHDLSWSWMLNWLSHPGALGLLYFLSHCCPKFQLWMKSKM